VAAVAPPRPITPKAVPASEATPGEQAPPAPAAATAVQPVAASATQPSSKVLSTSQRDASGTWAGDPAKLLGEQTPTVKKAVAKPKPKAQHYAQRSKAPRNKTVRGNGETTSL